MKTKIRILTLILILVGILFSTYFYSSYKLKSLESEIKECNVVARELRFSCFRASLENHFQKSKSSLEDFIISVKNNKKLLFKSDDNSYAIFGTNCHTFYHALGDLAATYSGTDKLEEFLKIGPSGCTAGYTMGLYKRLALKDYYSLDLLKRYYKVCPSGQSNQCAHEIGHLLHDKYTSSILKVLDDLSLKTYALNYPDKYQYISFDKVDLNAPFEDCEEIITENDNLVAQCYTGIGHNMFIFSEFSPTGYKDQFKECESVAEENKENCFGFLIYRIGINTVASKFISGKFDEGNKICSEVESLAGRDNLKHHCYIGLGGGIGLFIDSEYNLSQINDDNLVETKKTLLNFAALCEKSPEDFIDQCLAGLMGTRFEGFYKTLKLNFKRIEELRPRLDKDFKVVG